MAIEVKRLYQPSQQPEETRRKNAIRKTYRIRRRAIWDPVKLGRVQSEINQQGIHMNRHRRGPHRTHRTAIIDRSVPKQECGQMKRDMQEISKRVKEAFQNIFALRMTIFTW